MPKQYQHALAFVFAIHEINKNAKLIPNTTLGSKFLDDNFHSRKTYQNTLDLLSMTKSFSNYNCLREKKLMAIVGGLTSPNSIQMANILNTYKIPQVCLSPQRFSEGVLRKQRSTDTYLTPTRILLQI